MKNGLKKFWGTIKAELEMRPQPEQSQSGQVKQETSKTGILPPIMPEMHLKDMIQYRVSGEYLFHGSPIKLEPGKDVLEAKEDYFRLRLFLGDLPMALRFALVRKWGKNQLQATDFFVFASNQYKLVIYDGMSVGPNWYSQPDGNETYLYMVRRSDIEKNIGKETESGCVIVGGNAPIVARAAVNQTTLRDSGFVFALEPLKSTERWWKVPNKDAAIHDMVLSDCHLFILDDKQR